MGTSNTKKLRKHEANFQAYALSFIVSGMTDAALARKLLNIKTEIENLSNQEYFNTKLQSWNPPKDFLTTLSNVVKNEESRQETKAAIRGVVDTTITVNDYMEAIQFLEKANDINAWSDHLETMVDSFTMLRFLARSTKAGTEYMLDLQVQIQEDIWNERGEFYSWSKTSVEPDRGEDYSYELIEKWRACYHELLNQAYALYKVCKEHNEFLDLPRQIVEEFAMYN